jgi:hypothetical protein
MDSKLRSTVQERAKRACEYCLVPEKYDRLPFQLDHIIAEKHNGLTEVSNLAWSCYDCNIYKGPNIAGVDSQTGQVVTLFHPRQQTWHDHFAWHDGEFLGLTPAGRATIAVLRMNLQRRVHFRRELHAEGLLILE